jgi:hypothetical protein
MLSVSQITGYTAAAMQIGGLTSQVHHTFKGNTFAALSVFRLVTDSACNLLIFTFGAMEGIVPVCITSASVLVANGILGTGYVLYCCRRRHQGHGHVAQDPES